MRNVTLLIVLMLSVLFMPSCVEEAIISDANGDEQSVNLEFAFTIEGSEITRAISDGTTVDKLLYAIITESGEVVSKSSRMLHTNELKKKTVSMSVSLSAGCKYRAVFWAQSNECTAYTFNDDMTISVDYNGANNDEKRDAFYGVSDIFTLDGNVVKVTLKRPFAQLNAGAHPFDWEYAVNFCNFDVTKSAVRVRGIPNAISLLDGSVSGSTDADFFAAPIPNEKLMVDNDNNGKDEEYVYLSMSYILADTVVSTHSADFYFMDNDNRAVMFVNSGLDNVELQRNCHTDFIGQILTDGGELNFSNYVSTTTVYYNVATDTIISDIFYNMTGHGAMQFASVSGQKVTLNDIYITGDIWTIELGEYRGPKYVNYNNELNNVVLEDLRTTSVIECHEWYFSPAVIAYGNTELNNCSMTGASTVQNEVVDKHGVVHTVIPVDFGVRNESDCVINGGYFDAIFAWTHAVVDIYGAKIGTLYCGTCDSTPHSWMTIQSGTKIDSIICCEPRCPYGNLEYSTTMTIKAGAEVGSIQLVSTDVEFLIIEAGAKVGKITCEGVEYTYEELRSAMGL